MLLDIFCVCPPGVEALLESELRDLGLKARAVPGGAELKGMLETVARCNLWLRTASRVHVRLGSVQATKFPELVKKASALPFELCLRRGDTVALRVTCRKSRLYHSDAVAERLHAAIEARLGGAVKRGEAAGEEDSPADQLIVARFDRDLCTVSADASGVLLHQRGWRERGGKAPLRETLAAALLRAAAFRGTGPFLDPLCGSGTIAIEAALLARRRAPGLQRSFALERWPAVDGALWQRLLAEAREQELPRSPVAIAASDQDAGAIALARGNAERAGVAGDIDITQRPLSLVVPPPGPGTLVTNAPYGVRVGAEADLRKLYRELGELARSRLRGWTLLVLGADPRLAHAAGLPWEQRLKTQNGGIPVVALRSNMQS